MVSEKITLWRDMRRWSLIWMFMLLVGDISRRLSYTRFPGPRYVCPNLRALLSFKFTLDILSECIPRFKTTMFTCQETGKSSLLLNQTSNFSLNSTIRVVQNGDFSSMVLLTQNLWSVGLWSVDCELLVEVAANILPSFLHHLDVELSVCDFDISYHKELTGRISMLFSLQDKICAERCIPLLQRFEKSLWDESHVIW